MISIHCCVFLPTPCPHCILQPEPSLSWLLHHASGKEPGAHACHMNWTQHSSFVSIRPPYPAVTACHIHNRCFNACDAGCHGCSSHASEAQHNDTWQVVPKGVTDVHCVPFLAMLAAEVSLCLQSVTNVKHTCVLQQCRRQDGKARTQPI